MKTFKYLTVVTIIIIAAFATNVAEAGPLRRIVKKIVHRSQTQSATTGSCGASCANGSSCSTGSCSK